MPQERWNTDWIRQQQVGVVLGAFTQVRAGVRQLLGDLPRLQEQVSQLRNEALFEVAGLLPRLLGRAAADTPIDLSSGRDRDLTLI